MSGKNEHENLGIKSGDKQDSQSHIAEVLLRLGGLLVSLNTCPGVNREVLDQADKLHLRPQIKCGDGLYRIYDPEMGQGIIKKLEQEHKPC